MVAGSSSEEKDLQNVFRYLGGLQGVVGVVVLDQNQQETVLKLEEKAMENVLGGMGKGKNEGLKEALSKSIVLAMFTDMKFYVNFPPHIDTMKLICKGEVVGETTTDPVKLEKFKKDPDMIVISDFFALKKGAKINKQAFDCGDAYFLFSPIRAEIFAEIPEITDHVLSIPSPPVFDFIKKEFENEIDFSDPQLAVMILGLDLKT